jgi:hypothetical protein
MQMSTSDEPKIPKSLDPVPVVEIRKILANSRVITYQYNAKVQFYGQRYIVGTDFATVDAARAAAHAKCDELTKNMLDVAQLSLRGTKSPRSNTDHAGHLIRYQTYPLRAFSALRKGVER